MISVTWAGALALGKILADNTMERLRRFRMVLIIIHSPRALSVLGMGVLGRKLERAGNDWRELALARQ